MGVLDKFLDAIKLNDEDDDYLDDDILDDEEDFLDDEEPEEKPRRRFLDKFGSKKKSAKAADAYDDEEDDYEDEYDEYDDDLDEPEPEPVKKTAAAPRKAAPSKTRQAAQTVQPRVTSSVSSSRSTSSYRDDRSVRSSASSKITPMRQNRRSNGSAPNVEVCVIRPLSMENTREIADTLLDHSTVILNLEGIDVELAQRIIDFTSGACYSLGGTLQKVSSYIFVLGPSNVDITGDLQSILGGSAPSRQRRLLIYNRIFASVHHLPEPIRTFVLFAGDGVITCPRFSF